MYTDTLVREDEKILISDYGFEWYVGNELRCSGLVEDRAETIALLLDEGFELLD